MTTDRRRPPITTGGRPGSWSSSPTRTTPTSARPATAARWIDAGSEGWLVCCTSGDQGGEDPDADPLELAALRETEQRAAAAIIGYAGVTFLHQPDGALANDLALREQLVREIRTFRPDAVLATDPETIFYQRRRDQPHRPSGGRDRRRRRRLSGGPQPDGLPVAGPVGPRPPTGSGGSTCSGRSGPTPGSTCRRTLERKIDALRAHASQIHDPDGLAERIRTWAAEEGAAIGVDRGRGAPRWSSSTTTRTKARADAADGGQASSSRSGRIRPHWFQTSARPSARRPSIVTISARVRSPATPARYSSAATVDLAEQARPSRPRSASAGPASGRARRSRGRATGRAATGMRSSIQPPRPSNR